MPNFRVVAGGLILSGTVLASGLCAGSAAAQTAMPEPVGRPLQLLQLTRPGKSEATPHTRLAAKPAAKPDTKPHVSFRKKPRPHSQVAEHKRPQHHAPAPDMGAPPAQTAAAPAAQSVSPPAPAPAPIEAAATAAATPPAPPPALPTPSELVVGGHAVQVVSPDEANEIDLAANNASAPANDDPLYNLAAVTPAAASEAATPDTAASAPSADSAKATQPKSGVGSTSWFMQVMAALGGAVAAGSAAWFLIGSASPRINLSEWQEANSEE